MPADGTRPKERQSKPAKVIDIKRLPKTKKEIKQLALFPFFTTDDVKYSNTVHLYDAIPKYVRSKLERSGPSMPTMVRDFVFRGVMYHSVIIPARVLGDDGKTYYEVFPGDREEFVEDALRKMATTSDSGRTLNGLASVVFTLSELQKELKSTGHDFNIDDIKEALYVCNRTHISLSAQGQGVVASTMFPSLQLHSKEEWEESGRETCCFVRFNPLVSLSIRDRSFRQYDYLTCMSYRWSLSRYIHKRLSHTFLQASISNSYTIKLLTLLRDSGTTLYKSLSDNIREVKKALEEMKGKDVVREYTITPIINDKRKIMDADIDIRVTLSFVGDMKRANALSRDITLIQECSVGDDEGDGEN